MAKDKIEHGDFGSSFGVVVGVVTQGVGCGASTEAHADALAEDEAAAASAGDGGAAAADGADGGHAAARGNKAVVIAVFSDDGRIFAMDCSSYRCKKTAFEDVMESESSDYNGAVVEAIAMLGASGLLRKFPASAWAVSSREPFEMIRSATRPKRRTRGAAAKTVDGDESDGAAAAARAASKNAGGKAAKGAKERAKPPPPKKAAGGLVVGTFVEKSDGTVTKVIQEARYGKCVTFSGKKVKKAEVTELADADDGQARFEARLLAALDAADSDVPDPRVAELEGDITKLQGQLSKLGGQLSKAEAAKTKASESLKTSITSLTKARSDLDRSQSELSKSEDARCALAADLERSEAARIAAENADRRADRDGAGRGTDDRRDDRDGRDGDRRDDRDGAGRGRGDVGNDGRRDDRGSDQRNEYGTSGRRLVSSLENRPGELDADMMLMQMMSQNAAAAAQDRTNQQLVLMKAMMSRRN